MPRSKKPLPRLVPGGTVKEPERVEVDLPRIGASVVIQPPTVGAYLQIQQANLDDNEEAIALAAASLVEPEMSEDQFRDAIKSWPLTDWFVLSAAVANTMGTDRETLRDAQREFPGADE